MKIRLIDLTDENVDDVMSVCAFPSMARDKNVKAGLGIRKNWLLGLLDEVGSCAKVAYVKNRPAGMIQYTPLNKIPYFKTSRRDVLYLHCIYVREEFRNLDVGTKLLNSVMNDMKRPNKLFEGLSCRMLCSSARHRYGFTQPWFFKSKGFRRIKGNIDVGIVYPLSKTTAEPYLDIPSSSPRVIKERGVKIFFGPTCQYCEYTNERIKAEVRKANDALDVEEFDLWVRSDEALRRGITSVATYINGKLILPMSPKRFFDTLRRFALEAKG